MIPLSGGIRRANPSTALQVGPEASRASAPPFFHLARLNRMFNFSANHLVLVHRQDSVKCTVFVMRDHSTQRTYRLYDFSKALHLEPNRFYAVAGKVNSADKLYLVLESVKHDTKHAWPSPPHPPVEGAGE